MRRNFYPVVLAGLLALCMFMFLMRWHVILQREPDAAPHLELGAGIASASEEVSATNPASQAAPLTTLASGPAPARLDLNTATAAQLEQLPGIGPVLAGRVIEVRGRLGRFVNTSQLLEVDGIGQAKLAALAGLVEARTTD